jgi:hypothetical protein
MKKLGQLHFKAYSYNILFLPIYLFFSFLFGKERVSWIVQYFLKRPRGRRPAE